MAKPLPRRWRHVQAVAHAATDVGRLVGNDADLLLTAAWLHDIGYAPPLVVTRFHPLDGGEYLRSIGAEPRLCNLVAHHTAAAVEAGLRGVSRQLDRFTHEQSPLADALWWCDLTTGPDGTRVTLAERLAEIRGRYGPAHVVTRFSHCAEPQLRSVVERVERRL
ncbi:MAG TPA: HD domain-containing protein [Mycobacteriales bacterium]|nr:HD domain-containing protein [Mycobacteriales bacterium]